MKKLLSLSLIMAVGIGSTGLQAGNTMEKAWAYTKIAVGGVSLAAGCYMPWYANGLFQSMDAPTKGDARGVEEVSAYEAGRRKVLVEQGFLSPVALLPLGILLIKDGRRDLRRLGKRAEQEPIKQQETTESVRVELTS